jgi:O-6-methylguanine DNA methyltransferase
MDSTHTFSQGPKIAVHFLSKGNGDLRVRLLKSEEFSVSFFPKLPSTLQNEIMQWLLSYSEKASLPLLHLPRQILPPFSHKVLDTMIKIPFGKTLSYGELAKKAGSDGASRAVGTICRLNAFPLFIPCHRVLLKTGGIGNYAFGTPLKDILLRFEGVL